MTAFQGFLFACLAVMVLLWFLGLRKLERLLRRHPATYDEIGIENWWSDAMSSEESWPGRRPPVKVVRFIFGGGARKLRDPRVTRHVASMRMLGYAYVALFVLLAATILRAPPAEGDPPAPAPQASRVTAPESPAAANRQQERLDAALAGFMETIAREPTNFRAHVEADRVLSAQRRWDELLALWGRYLERVPGDAEAWYERAGTHFHKGDLAASLADVEQACRLGKAVACDRAQRVKAR